MNLNFYSTNITLLFPRKKLNFPLMIEIIADFEEKIKNPGGTKIYSLFLNCLLLFAEQSNKHRLASNFDWPNSELPLNFPTKRPKSYSTRSDSNSSATPS